MNRQHERRIIRLHHVSEAVKESIPILPIILRELVHLPEHDEEIVFCNDIACIDLKKCHS